MLWQASFWISDIAWFVQGGRTEEEDDDDPEPEDDEESPLPDLMKLSFYFEQVGCRFS